MSKNKKRFSRFSLFLSHESILNALFEQLKRERGKNGFNYNYFCFAIYLIGHTNSHFKYVTQQLLSNRIFDRRHFSFVCHCRCSFLISFVIAAVVSNEIKFNSFISVSKMSIVFLFFFSLLFSSIEKFSISENLFR